MKIKHNIVQDGCTLSGQITSVIFEEGEKRGGGINYYTKDKKFYIISSAVPELLEYRLYVWGIKKSRDNDIISYTYSTPEEAKQALNYINEFIIQEEEIKEQAFRKVYVSNISVEDALKDKEERILLHILPGNANHKYICVNYCDEKSFLKGKEYDTNNWEYIAEIPTIKTIKLKALINGIEKEIEITEEEFNKLNNK